MDESGIIILLVCVVIAFIVGVLVGVTVQPNYRRPPSTPVQWVETRTTTEINDDDMKAAIASLLISRPHYKRERLEQIVKEWDKKREKKRPTNT